MKTRTTLFILTWIGERKNDIISLDLFTCFIYFIGHESETCYSCHSDTNGSILFFCFVLFMCSTRGGSGVVKTLVPVTLLLWNKISGRRNDLTPLSLNSSLSDSIDRQHPCKVLSSLGWSFFPRGFLDMSSGWLRNVSWSCSLHMSLWTVPIRFLPLNIWLVNDLKYASSFYKFETSRFRLWETTREPNKSPL